MCIRDRRGESSADFWHELTGGYAGRQEITTEHIINMGKEDDPVTIDDSDLNF